MIEPAGALGLAFEALDGGDVLGDVGAEQLDGDLMIELQMAPAIDLAHSATPDALVEAVSAVEDASNQGLRRATHDAIYSSFECRGDAAASTAVNDRRRMGAGERARRAGPVDLRISSRSLRGT